MRSLHISRTRLRVLISFVGLWLAVAARPVAAQQFVDRVFEDASGKHKYSVFVPAGYRPDRKHPAILFLHGAGERGTDGRKQLTVGLGPYVKARGATFPFIAVFPQAEDTHGRLLTPFQAGQPDGARALKILDEVQRSYAVDPARVALVGWSMGGYGAWSLGAAHPQRWSAVVALSGGGDVNQVAALKNVPAWAFHGARDHLVPVEESRRITTALKEAGGRVTYTEFPDAGHEIFEQTFGNDGLIAWILEPQKAPAQLSAVSKPLVVEPPPFVPAVEIPQAVGVRLGNDALNALSYAAPQLVPANMLTGRLNDMYDSTSVQGRSFSVTFAGIGYSAQLERIQIKAADRDRVNVQIGLRNAIISIGGTYISGANHAAQAGPINIGIAHNRPEWLSINVKPYVDQQRLRLQLLNARFSIAPDNYYVTQPAGVAVRGFGLTEDRVVNGLVSGLYGARYRIENEIQAIVPGIVRQLEEQIKLTDAGPIISGLWPLPVYYPRLRVHPERVSTDENGISVVLGVTAAAFDPFAPPKKLATAPPAGITVEQFHGEKSLGVALAPEVMSPLMQLLIDSDLARIDLLDIPEKSFGRLAERQVLQEIIPDLARFDDRLQLRSELVLVAPLAIRAAPAGGADAAENTVPLDFQLPRVMVQVSTKTDPAQTSWKPYAQFELSIAEAGAASLQKPTHEQRVLELRWLNAPQISGQGRFAAGVEPQNAQLDADKFAGLFRESWEKWTASGAAANASVPDVVFAKTKLRLQQLTAQGTTLMGAFEVPTVKITNSSPEDFVYETKGPYSGWGAPLRLPPGESHEFAIPYPLLYRRTTKAGTEVYTLYAGSHSECLVPPEGGPPRLFKARKPAPAAASGGQ